MDNDELEQMAVDNAHEIRLLAAFLGVSLGAVHEEGVALCASGGSEPTGPSGLDRVRRLGWSDEQERGWGGES